MIHITPEVGQKAAEGQTITLKCTVFGSPKPQVIWHKSNEQLTGGRYKVMDHGDLRITVGHIGQINKLNNSVCVYVCVCVCVCVLRPAS